jgi:myo-inositol-1(or 4)-monophosphatase
VESLNELEGPAGNGYAATPADASAARPEIVKLRPAGNLLERVIATAKRVGAEQIMPFYLRVAHQRKADGSLFTECDLAAQEALLVALPQLVPGPVIGEEMSQEEQAQRWTEGRQAVWCVDPIDGTSNFVAGLPFFAVSVALMREGRPVLGVVHNPVAEETFYAERGGGAYLNGERLPIRTHVPHIRNAMAQVDFKRLPTRLSSALASAPPYSSQRNYGAGTLEWCYLAAGRFDLGLHGGQKLWDYAAGALILEEAGGKMCTLHEDDFWNADLWRRSVIASRDPGLFEAWRTWVRARL